MVENESDKSIKNLRTDNGEVFTKHEFNPYLYKHGIQYQKIVLYTPQQDGVVERKNRNLVEMDRLWFILNVYINIFGLNLFVVLTIFWIESLPKKFCSLLPKKKGTTRNLNLGTYRYLPMNVGHISWMEKGKISESKFYNFNFIGYSEESKAYMFFYPST